MNHHTLRVVSVIECNRPDGGINGQTLFEGSVDFLIQAQRGQESPHSSFYGDING
jgi:hypothetical protein